MWRKVCISYEPSYKNNVASEIQSAKRVCFEQTLYQH